MIIYDAEITGSFKIDGTTISSIGSLDTLSGSIVTNSSSIASLEAASSSYANSSSFATDISSNSSSIASLNAASSSYLLNTTDTLTGDLTVTGTITAQEFHTEYVSASIIYSSGSTQFGDTVDDTHIFSGSTKFYGTEFTVKDNNYNESLLYATYMGATIGSVTRNIPLTVWGNSTLNGNVGIGIASPSAPLHVDKGTSGTIAQFEGTGSIHLAIEESGSNMYLDANNGNAVLGFKTNDVERMRINSAGNVGINNTSPSAMLDVKPNANTSYASSTVDAVRIGRTAAGRPSISFDTSDTTYTNRVWFIENYGPAASLNFGRNGLDVMSLRENGDVYMTNGWIPGNPSKLTIRGEGEYNNTFSRPGATLQIVSDELSNNTWSPVFNIAVVRQSLTTGKDSFGGIGFSSIDDSNNNGQYDAARIAVINESPSSVITPTSLAFYTNAGVSNSNAATEKVRINSSGSVGIGTDAPSTALHILNTSSNNQLTLERTGTATGKWGIYTNTNALYFYDNAQSSFRMVINPNGNVGIDNTLPTEKLHVNGNIRIEGTGNELSLDTDGANSSIGIKAINQYEAVVFNDRGSAGFAVVGNSNIRFGFGTDYSAAQSDLLIQSTGNIGINNSSPSGARLCVNGTSGTDVAIKAYYDMYLFNTLFLTDASFTKQAAVVGSSNELILKSNGGSTEGIRIDANGNVGINTTNPGGVLHVYNGSSERLLVDSDVKVAGSTDLAITGTDRRLSFTSGTGTVRTTTSSSLYLSTNNDHRVAISSTGMFSSKNAHSGQSLRREYTYSTTVANGSTIDLIGNTDAYSDVTFIAFVEILHSSRSYGTIIGAFGGYGYNATGGGSAYYSLTQTSTGTGTAKLQWTNSSGYTAGFYIHIVIYGDNGVTAYNGSLSSAP